MSKPKKTTKEMTYAGFGGIDHTLGHDGGRHAQDIVNFRILKNGSLQKRQGFRPLAQISGAVRAIFSNVVGGSFTTFLLAESTVYTLDSETGALQSIGDVGTSSGDACFFFFNEELFLTDGDTIYRYTGSGFSETEGYVPLVGKEWRTTYIGETYEPRNILNRHARINYLIEDMSSVYLCAGAPIESVEAVYVNDILTDPADYSIDTLFNTVNIMGLSAGDRVDVHLTYKDGYDSILKRLCLATCSAILGGIENNKIFLCGNNTSGTVFCSRSVDDSSIAESKKCYPLSNGLYFPVNAEFDAGDGINALQALIRYHDKLLIFTEGDVWMVSPQAQSSNGSEATGVNAGIGCPVQHGATLTDNDPVSIGRHSIWLWNASDAGKICTAKSISLEIDDELGEKRLESCGILYHAARNELWIYSRAEPIAWIYNFQVEAWYKFTGFTAETMLDLNGRVAFLQDGIIYVFDDPLSYDILSDGSSVNINASYLSGIIDFGSDRFKNLAALTLRGDLLDENVTFEFLPDKGSQTICDLNDGYAHEHSVIRKRISSGRFKYGRLRLTCAGEKQQLIHSVTLSTR